MKRTLAIVLMSPILLVMALMFLIVAIVGYALSGKWELKNMVKSFMES